MVTVLIQYEYPVVRLVNGIIYGRICVTAEVLIVIRGT
jgi:hypothetical protein